MKRSIVLVAMLAMAVPAFAMPGDQWTVTSYALQGNGWTHSATGGYAGAGFDYAAHADGVRRAIWQLPADVPFGYYSLEAWIPSTHAVAWIPYEVDSTFPMDSRIPWDGTWSTNHQYAAIDQNSSYGWTQWGAGPHTPNSTAQNAGDNGTAAWMGGDLRTIYLKFDYGWDLAEVGVSAIRVTQLVPEPASALLLLLGMPLLRRKSR